MGRQSQVTGGFFVSQREDLVITVIAPDPRGFHEERIHVLHVSDVSTDGFL